MSQSQVTLPALSEEENTVVERFVERSRDIVPGVEVTLAKRILRPGSNRVVCLAARTSVPINDDELASVSDLAVRLSDGTNVVLSLSFFNDTITGDYIPFSRSTYDPNRYSMRSESKLGTVLLAMCLVGLAGVYSLATNPFNKYMQQTGSVSKITACPTGAAFLRSTKSSGIAKKNAIASPIETPAKSFAVTSARPLTKSPAGVGEHWKERRSSVRAKTFTAQHLPREEMLVPPPPATYVAPYYLPEQILNQISGLNPPTKTAKPSAKPEAKTPPVMVKKETSPVNAKPNQVLEAPRSEERAETKAAPTPESRGQVRQEASADYSYKNQTGALELERIPAFDVPPHSSAPLPGLTPPLERIVPSSR